MFIELVAKLVAKLVAYWPAFAGLGAVFQQKKERALWGASTNKLHVAVSLLKFLPKLSGLSSRYGLYTDVAP